MGKRANGEGSVYKLKDGTWRAVLTVGVDPRTGRQRRKTKSASTQKGALRLLREMSQQHAVLADHRSSQTLAAFADNWLRTKAGSVRPRTLESYRGTLERHVLPHLGRTRIEDLRTYAIQRVLDAVAESSGRRTANYTRTVLNVAMNQAVKWDILARNPVLGTVRKSESPKPKTIWTADEIRRFLSVAMSHRLYALFYLLLTTGLRRGEVLALRWQDVEDDAIIVSHSVETRAGIVVESAPKSATSRRVVAIDPDTVGVLLAHRARQREELLELGMQHDEVPVRVFTNELGATLDGSNVTKIWHRLQDEAGVPRARLHDARHMHLSMLIANGVDIRTVSDRAGHADPVLTMRQYAHALEAQRKRAAIPLDKLLEG